MKVLESAGHRPRAKSRFSCPPPTALAASDSTPPTCAASWTPTATRTNRLSPSSNDSYGGLRRPGAAVRAHRLARVGLRADILHKGAAAATARTSASRARRTRSTRIARRPLRYHRKVAARAARATEGASATRWSARANASARCASAAIRLPCRIGVVGEIFCRLNTFSNEDLVRRLEEFGAEVWLSDITEWVWYTSAEQPPQTPSSGTQPFPGRPGGLGAQPRAAPR